MYLTSLHRAGYNPGPMWPSVTMAGWIFVPFFALACVACGFYALVKWIPGTPIREFRTDIYSVRASCYVIGVGLLIFAVWALDAVAVRTIAMLRALYLA